MKTHLRLQNLNEICEQSSKTKAAIAREMGISPQQLNNIIHLHRPIPLHLISPFAKLSDAIRIICLGGRTGEEEDE